MTNSTITSEILPGMITAKQAALALGINQQRTNRLMHEDCWYCDGEGCEVCRGTGKRLPSVKVAGVRWVRPEDLYLVQDRGMEHRRSNVKHHDPPRRQDEYMAWLEAHIPEDNDDPPCPNIPYRVKLYCPGCEGETVHSWCTPGWRCRLCKAWQPGPSDVLAQWEWEGLNEHHSLSSGTPAS